MKPERLAVIVATYNRPDALAAVLRALAAQTDHGFETLVADDGSREHTRAVIERQRPAFPVKLRHVWHPDDGFRLAAIRNKGILAADADYLVFLDGDCLPQPDFVARHRQLAEPRRMLTGSRILLGERLTGELLAGDGDFFRLGLSRRLRERYTGGVNKLLPLWFKLPDGPFRHVDRFVWRRIKGANLAAWRDDVFRVNGFDESFTGWGHEDADFVLRLCNDGVGRKDGAWATEVLHLWHREAQRDQASSNRETVRARIESGEVRAAVGLDEARARGDFGRVD